MEVQWFILMKTIVFQGYRGLPSFSKGSFEFFSGAGVKMLISIETYITYDLSEGGGGCPDPIPPQIRACTHLTTLKHTVPRSRC